LIGSGSNPARPRHIVWLRSNTRDGAAALARWQQILPDLANPAFLVPKRSGLGSGMLLPPCAILWRQQGGGSGLGAGTSGGAAALQQRCSPEQGAGAVLGSVLGVKRWERRCGCVRGQNAARAGLGCDVEHPPRRSYGGEALACGAWPTEGSTV